MARSECADLPERTNADVVVVANRITRWPALMPLQLSALREHLAGRRGLLVVDEAFADIDPSLSMAPHAGPRVLGGRSEILWIGRRPAGLRDWRCRRY